MYKNVPLNTQLYKHQFQEISQQNEKFRTSQIQNEFHLPPNSILTD